MNKVLLFITILFAISCNSTSEKAPGIISEEYNPSIDSLFLQCQDLRGISQYQVGKTTFRQVVRDKDFRMSNEYDVYNHLPSSFYNGYWGGVKFQGNKSSEKSNYIEKQCKGKIKQLCSPLSGYKIGDIEFDDFDMVFLNDTLVAVYFKPKSNFEDDVLTHFKEKYGNGVGSYYKLHFDNEPCENREYLRVTEEVKEFHSWQNERVVMEYNYQYSYKMAPGSKLHYYKDMWYIVYNRNRYPVFEYMLKEYAKQYDNLQQESKTKALNSL